MKQIFAALLSLVLCSSAGAQGLMGLPLWPTPTQPGWAQGQQLFSNASPLNTKISGSPTFTTIPWPAPFGPPFNAGNYWATVNGNVEVPNPNTAPVVAITVGSGWGNPAGTINLQVTSGVTGGYGSDAHINIYDQASGRLYNFWVFNRTSDTTATASQYAYSCVAAGSSCSSGPETGFGTASPFHGGGATAIGMSEAGGLILRQEVANGVIPHKIAITLGSTFCKSGAPVPPAINSDCSGSSGVLQGQIMAIPASVKMPKGLSPAGQMIFTAMQTYGAIAMDQGFSIIAMVNFDNTNGVFWYSPLYTNIAFDMNLLIPLLEACGPC